MIAILPEVILFFLVIVLLISILWIIKILIYIEGIKKWQKIIIFLFIIIIGAGLAFLIFLGLERANFIRPKDIVEAEKPSLLTDFPQPPSFVEVDNFYFSGPFLIDKQYRESPVAIWIIFCNDDIIGTGTFYPDKPDFVEEEKNCFYNHCSDPYYAVLPFFTQEDLPQLEKNIKYLINKFNPECNFYEE